MNTVINYSHLQAIVEGPLSDDVSRTYAKAEVDKDLQRPLFKSMAKLAGAGDSEWESPLKVGKGLFAKSFGPAYSRCRPVRNIVARNLLAKRGDLCLGVALRCLATGNHRGVLEILEELATFDHRSIDTLSKKFPQLKSTWVLDEDISLEGAKEEIESIRGRNREYLDLAKKLKIWVVVKLEERNRLDIADTIERGFLTGMEIAQLDYSNSNISRLPDIFNYKMFKTVVELDLSNTQLTELNLYPFSHLKILRAVKTPLTMVDIHWNRELETVDLRDCALTMLPKGLDFIARSHPHLTELDLTGNALLMRDYEIRQKEDWIPGIQRLQTTYFNIYENLAVLVPDDEDIVIGPVFLRRAPILMLKEVNRWIEGLKEGMVNYSEPEQRELGKLVKKFFCLASTNQRFRQQFIGIIGEAAVACIDGLTLSLMHLTRAELTLRIDSKNPMSAVEVLTIFVKMDLLEGIAKEKIRRLHESPASMVDEDGINSIARVERDILLMYPAHLRERLGLPFVIGHTQFANRTHVNEGDLAAAGNDVEAIVSDPDRLHAEFMKNPIWEELVQVHYPEQYRQISLRVHALSDRGDYSAAQALEKGEMVGLSKLCATAPVAPISDKDFELLRRILQLSINEKKQKILAVLGLISKYLGRNVQEEVMIKYNEGLSDDLPRLTRGSDNPMMGLDRHLLLHILKGLLTTPPEERAGDPLARRVRARVEE